MLWGPLDDHCGYEKEKTAEEKMMKIFNSELDWDKYDPSLNSTIFAMGAFQNDTYYYPLPFGFLPQKLTFENTKIYSDFDEKLINSNY